MAPHLLTHPDFDKKYRIIIEVDETADCFGMMDWINSNSKCSVEVKSTDSRVYFGFEDRSDATLFKIKYSVKYDRQNFM